EICERIQSCPKQSVKHPLIVDSRRSKYDRRAVVGGVYLSVVVDKAVQKLKYASVLMRAFHAGHNEALDVTLCYGSLCCNTWEAVALQVKKIFFNDGVIGL